jgi:hypothetical protein
MLPSKSQKLGVGAKSWNPSRINLMRLRNTDKIHIAHLTDSGGLAGSSPNLKSNISARVLTDSSSAPVQPYTKQRVNSRVVDPDPHPDPD